MSPVQTVAAGLASSLRAAFSDLGVAMTVVSRHDGQFHRELFVTPSTAAVVSVAPASQVSEPLRHCTLTASVTLTVRLDDDLDGSLFESAHDAVWALWALLATDDRCERLGGDDFAVDGFQIEGGEGASLDAEVGVGSRSCVFSAALTGRFFN